ncbi:hypothetical protein GA0070607_3454 [Micromonospora coriariae]|uniref:Uncharacterized protein n=1 Tax=Micromonospora coriariae TaxID=285665 RepID=A0A1C4WCP8_9ACTN|nr:hypothetical protein [Micromonospora coriariae]SCE94016.1 hypothetical protein GA0070607_3454 [Micromonospora coriariae]
MTLPAAPVSVVQGQDAPPPAGPPPRLLDLGLRVAGAIIVVVAGVLTGVLELLFSTVRVGGQLIGVSALLAVGANIALSWFAYEVVGRRWAVALPAVPWFVLMAVAAVRTSEGDLLLAGDNWVGLAMIVAGAMTFAVMGFRQILAPPPALGG